MTSRDVIIDEIGSAQLGLLAYDQLTAAGFSRGEIRGMVRRERLRPLRPHVFVVAGAPRSHEQRVLAAVLAAGKSAFASHETALQLWALPLSHPAPLEVTIVLDRFAHVSGVKVHRSGLLRESDAMELRSIPVASPERAIVDVSSRLSLTELGRVVDEAVRRRITSLRRIEYASARLGRAPGRSPKRVAEMLARRLEGGDQRESDLEDFVFGALQRFGLPLPVPQHRVVVDGHRRRLDLAYPARLVMLDVLGYDYHRGRERFDGDSSRRNALRRAKWDVVELTSAFDDWEIAREVARALGKTEPGRPAVTRSFEEWLRLR